MEPSDEVQPKPAPPRTEAAPTWPQLATERLPVVSPSIKGEIVDEPAGLTLPEEHEEASVSQQARPRRTPGRTSR